MNRRNGFTLVELLVVIVIVMLVAAAVIPTAISAVQHRQVSEAARLLQASLVGARDRAMQSGQPRGIRLLPDPAFMNRPGTAIQAANRWVQIETAPDYTTGRVSIRPEAGWTTYQTMNPTGNATPYLVLHEEWFSNWSAGTLQNELTSWAWNVRVGDKLRLNDSGRYYTVVGPVTVANPEGFINYGAPGTAPPVDPDGHNTEFLFLVNGQDDDLNGYVDDGFDGIDNNLNGPFPNPTGALMDMLDTAEWELESWVGAQGAAVAGYSQAAIAYAANPTPATLLALQQAGASVRNVPYTISRRPVPAQTGQETTLPSEIVIDLTTLNGTNERSRLPLDRVTNYVEVMLNPDGQVVPTTSYSSPSSIPMAAAFYHFWLAERKDIFEPTGATFPSLPMPETAYDMSGNPSGYTGPQFLTGERMLVTLYARTGQTVANSIEFFSASDLNMPFYAAQIGYTEAK